MGSPDVELRSQVHTVQYLSVLLGPTKAYIGRSNIQIRDMSMINKSCPFIYGVPVSVPGAAAD